jgi:hypothetical protein
MRNSKQRDLTATKPFALGWTVLRATLAGTAVCLLLTANVAPAFAGDDNDEDDLTFEQKIIRGFMHGIGAQSDNDKGIDYRERSPLVVPPNKVELPAPQTASTPSAPNWPKDPDVEERKKLRAANKARDKEKEFHYNWLTPDQLNPSRDAAARSDALARARSKTSAPQPGYDPESGIGRPMTPGQLGGNITFFNMFKGSSGPETAPFEGEPPRATLTDPPIGYQTPSPNYAYGAGVQDTNNKSKAIDDEHSLRPKAPGTY